MSDQKDQKTLTDAQLDRLMGRYDVPELDGAAFNKNLMSRIGADRPDIKQDTHVVVWSRRKRFAGFAALLLLAAAFMFGQTVFETGPEQRQFVQMAALNAGVQGDEFADIDDFLNEIIDQDIAVLEYSVAMNINQRAAVDENPARENGGEDLPSIDEFLDEILGLESRTL